MRAGRGGNGVCWQYGPDSATYYTWNSKYGGMAASDIQRIKMLEE